MRVWENTFDQISEDSLIPANKLFGRVVDVSALIGNK
jgi:hypothetical protein